MREPGSGPVVRKPEERQRAGREPIRMYGYAVTMNPGCFSASEGEDAQSGLDALTQMGG